jgi:hypothetical protein
MTNEQEVIENDQTGLINNDEPEIEFQLRQHEKKLKIDFYYFIDLFLSAVIFTPLSGFYWYGSWSFIDSYFLTSNAFLSAMLSYLIGLSIILPSYLFQLKLQHFYNNYCDNIIKRFLFKLTYVYFLSIGIVFEWRGCWELCDMAFNLDWKNELSISIIAVTYLLITRSFRLMKSSPYVLTYDYFDDEYFITKSRFTQLNNFKYLQYSFDFLLSELIESFVVIIAWRGLSIVFDLFIFPDNYKISILITLLIGYLAFFLLALVQFKIYTRIQPFTLVPRLFFEDLLNLIMFLSLILLWKGYWDFCDNFIYYENYQFEIYVILHFVSFLIVILTNSSVSIIGCGCEYKDGELECDEQEGDSQVQSDVNGCFFRIDYVGHILIKRKDGIAYSRVVNQIHEQT